jgi:hypothetical protein
MYTRTESGVLSYVVETWNLESWRAMAKKLLELEFSNPSVESSLVLT